MKNLLKSEMFNRFEATKDRSPRFRAFVIFLVLLIGGLLLYAITFKRSTTEIAKDAIPQPATVISR